MPPAFVSRIKRAKSIPCRTLASGSGSSHGGSLVDLRQEYANAFRTQSYNDFWTRVTAMPYRDSTTFIPNQSTTSSRLSSYRIFAENLLEPDQTAVKKILASPHFVSGENDLLYDYFDETAEASLLCSHLLKDVDHIRIRYRSFQAWIKSLGHDIHSNRLGEFTGLVNPFLPTAPSPSRLRLLQTRCAELLKRLETSRDKAHNKLRFLNGLKHSSGVFLVALTVSLAVAAASHAFALIAAGPGLVAVSIELASRKMLKKMCSHLDAASKGAYTVNRDLDTTSRLLVRLNHEVEHIRTMVGFWVERGEHRVGAGSEVARQLKLSDDSLSQQLDEVEEHLYLFFMTINRARNLVVKEILDPSPVAPKPKS